MEERDRELRTSRDSETGAARLPDPPPDVAEDGGTSPRSPVGMRRHPRWLFASLARDRTDPSRGAGRTAIAYLGMFAAIMVFAAGIWLLLGPD